MMRRLRSAAGILLMLSMSGCFTGIESTPKITANDVKREQVVETEEDRYLADIRPMPLGEWEAGKLFYVTDDKINLALEPSSTPSPKSGDLLAYQNYRTVPSMTGTDDTELIFLDSHGQQAIYKINATPEELMKRSRINVPFTIELSLVDATRAALLGQRLYIRTSAWYNNDGSISTGLKFVPVDIVDVEAGNLVYPVKIKFTTPAATNPSYVYMSIGDDVKVARNFASLFNFNDPHAKYPQITDETWTNIIHGRVRPYMTREECRLALGAPKSVDRAPGVSTMREVWSYENGIYLIFDDGLLRDFRR